MIQKIQRELFDVLPDGTLVYTDPTIGALQSPRRGLAVTLNAQKSCFELTHQGHVEQVIDLAQGVGRACREAFAAYFDTLERLCRSGDVETAAA